MYESIRKNSWLFLEGILDSELINSEIPYLMFYFLMHISYIFSPVHQWAVAAFVSQNTLKICSCINEERPAMWN